VNCAVSNSLTVEATAAMDTVMSSSSLMVTVERVVVPAVNSPPPLPVWVGVPRSMTTVSFASFTWSAVMVTVMSSSKSVPVKVSGLLLTV